MPSFKLTSLAIAAASLLGLASAQDQGCSPAGSGQCTLMVYADMMYFPSGTAPGLSQNRYSDVTDGNCNSILTSGDLEPQSPGFYGSLETSYGTTVQAWASWIATGDIEGVSLQYDGETVDQSSCSSGHFGFDPATSYVQCNFAC